MKRKHLAWLQDGDTYMLSHMRGDTVSVGGSPGCTVDELLDMTDAQLATRKLTPATRDAIRARKAAAKVSEAAAAWAQKCTEPPYSAAAKAQQPILRGNERGAVMESYRTYMSEVHEMYPELGDFDPCENLHLGDLVEEHILRPLCDLLGCYNGGERTIPPAAKAQQPADRRRAGGGVMREWQAGDLVQRDGQWIVLPEDGGWPWHGNPDDDDGPDVMPPDVTLLAAADADLWEALRGLPGADAIAGHEVEIYLGGDLEACIVDRGDGPKCWLRTYDNLHTDSAPLEQAIQRFKAIKQYIEVQNGNV